eukprot:g11039.t1
MSSFEGLCLSFTHFLNVLNALQRLAKYTQVPEEAASDNPMDFSVLKRSKIRRDELVPLQMRAEGKIAGESTDSASLRICVRGGKPLLRLGADGRHLEFLDGCTPEEPSASMMFLLACSCVLSWHRTWRLAARRCKAWREHFRLWQSTACRPQQNKWRESCARHRQ